mmetsp:Transcript_21430/g.54975  ORF Transcript_21430/g.54975 Transcript_21430/m.54975 type:complete len:238 (-) Transcript_21430:1056-1769(-)
MPQIGSWKCGPAAPAVRCPLRHPRTQARHGPFHPRRQTPRSGCQVPRPLNSLQKYGPAELLRHCSLLCRARPRATDARSHPEIRRRGSCHQAPTTRRSDWKCDPAALVGRRSRRRRRCPHATRARWYPETRRPSESHDGAWQSAHLRHVVPWLLQQSAPCTEDGGVWEGSHLPREPCQHLSEHFEFHVTGIQCRGKLGNTLHSRRSLGAVVCVHCGFVCRALRPDACLLRLQSALLR